MDKPAEEYQQDRCLILQSCSQCVNDINAVMLHVGRGDHIPDVCM